MCPTIREFTVSAWRREWWERSGSTVRLLQRCARCKRTFLYEVNSSSRRDEGKIWIFPYFGNRFVYNIYRYYCIVKERILIKYELFIRHFCRIGVMFRRWFRTCRARSVAESVLYGVRASRSLAVTLLARQVHECCFQRLRTNIYKTVSQEQNKHLNPRLKWCGNISDVKYEPTS